MATRLLSRQNLRKLAASFTLLNPSQKTLLSHTPPVSRSNVISPNKCLSPFYPFVNSWGVRWASYESVNLVLSDDGKPNFEIEEVEPSKKGRYLTKKRLKLQRKWKEANTNDPRRIRPKGKKIKQKFPTAEARLKYKIEKAKLKEAMLVEKLIKRYEVARAQGPVAKPDDLNGEERFYLKKVSQKKSNYVPIGRHLKNQNMNNRWRQFGVSLQYLKRSLNYTIGMLHFMENHNVRVLIWFMAMIEKFLHWKWRN